MGSLLLAPVQTFMLLLQELAAAVVILAPAIMGTVTALKGLAALKIGATIAGWLPVMAVSAARFLASCQPLQEVFLQA